MPPIALRRRCKPPGLVFTASLDLVCSSGVGLASDELWVVDLFIPNHLLSPLQPGYTCTQIPMSTRKHADTPMLRFT